MCLFSSPAPAPVVAPEEPAQAKTPDYAGAEGAAARRTSDRLRSGSNTVLTTPQGVQSSAATAASALTAGTPAAATVNGAAGDGTAPKKTLLGN
ncbi:hypothetical protein HF263_03000 [Rhizobium leguminosarum]|jgi:hypothetical protein|uniref:hypothetical protein n=1 Tax=Rhizobium leguminosarum TaxID=384 RepID=UPI001C90618F|nr:hypothetical protein [Rhizobium leguminosarum]MBY3055047.1 hypothetical protein [Rhizobium leguminosarum]